MNPLVKVIIAAGAGAFLASYVEPHIVGLVKPESDMAKKAVSAGSVGLTAGAVYFALGKV